MVCQSTVAACSPVDGAGMAARMRARDSLPMPGTVCAVNRDMPVRKIRKDQWLIENVVPSLPKGAGDRRNHVPKSWLFDYADPVVKRRERIADDVMDFIRAAGPDVELWANYGAYDHVCLAQLWGRMIDLPKGVPMFTHDIQQEARRQGLTWDDLPIQESGEHNALADARHNQTVRRWLANQGVS
ncbi:3'-5' exoribonuclease [Streptomyces tendae]